ncbi:hypothetical protein [Tetragenococcus halophilus]|uniref:hypothetical protein n=1 Tax=Tetragenococcus halophilus TaxID=51669 RepID=UPI00300FB118
MRVFIVSIPVDLDSDEREVVSVHASEYEAMAEAYGYKYGTYSEWYIDEDELMQ